MFPKELLANYVTESYEWRPYGSDSLGQSLVLSVSEAAYVLEFSFLPVSEVIITE